MSRPTSPNTPLYSGGPTCQTPLSIRPIYTPRAFFFFFFANSFEWQAIHQHLLSSPRLYQGERACLDPVTVYWTTWEPRGSLLPSSRALGVWESSRWVCTLTCNYSWDDNAFTREVGWKKKKKKKSIILELLSLSALQITCAEEKKKLPRIRSLDLNSIPRQWQADRKREQTSVGSLGGNPELKSLSSVGCALNWDTNPKAT